MPSLAAASTPHVRIAENLEELLAAYRLVYRRYAERGLVRRRAGGNTLFLGVWRRRQPDPGRHQRRWRAERDRDIRRGGGRFFARSHYSLADASAPDLNRRLAGVTCLAAASSATGPSPVAFFALARYLFQYAKYRGFEGLVISIHPRQLRFYGRICPIVPLGPAYRQAKLGNALAVACRIDLDAASLSSIAPGCLFVVCVADFAAGAKPPGHQRCGQRLFESVRQAEKPPGNCQSRRMIHCLHPEASKDSGTGRLSGLFR